MHAGTQRKASLCMQTPVRGLRGCVPVEVCLPWSLNTDLHPRQRLQKMSQRKRHEAFSAVALAGSMKARTG